MIKLADYYQIQDAIKSYKMNIFKTEYIRNFFANTNQKSNTDYFKFVSKYAIHYLDQIDDQSIDIIGNLCYTNVNDCHSI